MMRTGRLYIKIFLSFLGVLVVTEILIFGLFMYTAGRTFKDKIEQYAGSKIIIAKQFVEEKARISVGQNGKQGDSLEDLLDFIAKTYYAKIWIANKDGEPLIKSFQGPIPQSIQNKHGLVEKRFDTYTVYHRLKKHWFQYCTAPIEYPAHKHSTLHILYEKEEMERFRGIFALGLLGVGVVIALLVIPISRFITEPLRQLGESALRIAEGDLSHRAKIKRKNEIGELGRTFNIMADKVERMIRGGKELTANVSHELRSPLARIRVAEELIRARMDQDGSINGKRHLDAIREDIEELDALIESILVFSKLDVRDARLKSERLDVVEILNNLLARFESSAQKKSLRISVKFPDCCYLSGDKDTLRTAFSNLVENAIKFTPEKGNINVALHSDPGRMTFSIENSYPFSGDEDLGRIFDPFCRIEDSGQKGTGLGLAITKRIIEKHNGTIEALATSSGMCIKIRLSVTMHDAVAGSELQSVQS